MRKSACRESNTRMTSVARIVDNRWAMTNEVRPANSGFKAAWMSCSDSLSRLEVASSRMRIQLLLSSGSSLGA